MKPFLVHGIYANSFRPYESVVRATKTTLGRSSWSEALEMSSEKQSHWARTVRAQSKSILPLRLTVSRELKSSLNWPHSRDYVTMTL